MHVQRDESFLHQVAHFVRERLEQKFSHPHVVDQLAAFIHHVDDVECLAVLTMLAHVIEHRLHRPIFTHRDEIGRHQTADAAFRITEERLGDAPFFRREQFDQLPRRRAG